MKITIEVDLKTVVNCIGAGHIGYWAQTIAWNGAHSAKTGDVRLVIEENYDRTSRVMHRLGQGDFERGIALMAKTYPHHFADLVGGTCDSITGDILIQMTVFGEIKYQ